MITKTQREIETVQAAADDVHVFGSAYPGMSYEEGVSDALRWVLGSNDDNEYPFDGGRHPEDEDYD